MCVICEHYLNKTLSAREADKNLEEMKEVISEEHYNEVFSMIWDELWDEDFKPKALSEGFFMVGSTSEKDEKRND